jgi:hypothetical protein
MCTQYVRHWEEGYDVINMAMGFIDFVVGIVILLSSDFVFTSNILIISVSFLYLLWGIRSLGRSFMKSYFFDWRGYVNIISAISLILIYYGIVLGAFEILGIIIIIKGLISAISIIMKQ